MFMGGFVRWGIGRASAAVPIRRFRLPLPRPSVPIRRSTLARALARPSLARFIETLQSRAPDHAGVVESD